MSITNSYSFMRHNNRMKHPEFSSNMNGFLKSAGLDKESNKKLGKRWRVSSTMVWNYRNGEKLPSIDTARLIAKDIGISVDMLLAKEKHDFDTISPQSSQIREVGSLYDVDVASDGDEAYEIAFYDAKGSCGGGVLNGDDFVKGKLIKEAGFFRKYGVEPRNVKGIYADGDSNADFIVHGDLVLFDISKKEPLNGKMFLLRYPEGMRIKILIEQANGRWKIRSRSPSVHDEEIVEADEVEIVGQYFYRRG